MFISPPNIFFYFLMPAKKLVHKQLQNRSRLHIHVHLTSIAETCNSSLIQFNISTLNLCSSIQIHSNYLPQDYSCSSHIHCTPLINIPYFILISCRTTFPSVITTRIRSADMTSTVCIICRISSSSHFVKV